MVADLVSVPPDAAVNQPVNVYPVLLVVASVPYGDPKVTDLVLCDGASPPLLLKVTVIVIPVHCANKVWLEALDTMVAAVTCVPPDEAVNHPLNVYPVQIGVGSVPYADPKVTCAVPGTTALPPLLL